MHSVYRGSTSEVRKSFRFAVQQGCHGQLLWLTAFENILDDTLSKLPKKLSLASHSAEEICMELFEMKTFSVQYNLTSLIVKNIVLKPVFYLATLFARREAKTRIRQRDWLTLVGEKIRREQVGTVPTFFLFARTNSPSGTRA